MEKLYSVGLEDFFATFTRERGDSLYGRSELKYLVIKEKGKDPSIIVCNPSDNILRYHAQALLAYMEEANIQEIDVNGGGTMNCYRIPNTHLYKRSGSFGNASREILEGIFAQSDKFTNLSINDVVEEVFWRRVTIEQVRRDVSSL